MLNFMRCSGTMSGGTRLCHYNGVIKIHDKWYCRIHTSQATKIVKPIPAKELQEIKKKVRRYQANGTLGRNVDYEKLWASTVPVLLEEILIRRKID